MCLCWTNIRLHAATLCPDRSVPPSALYPSGSRLITAIFPQSPTCIPQLFACPIPSVTAIFTHARTLHTHYTHTNGAAAVSFSHSCSNLLPHYALQTAPFVAATLTHLSRHSHATTHASQPHSPGHHTRPILSRALPYTHPPTTHTGPTGHRQNRPLQVSEGDGRVRQVHGKQVERKRATVVPSRRGVSHRGQVQGRQRMNN